MFKDKFTVVIQGPLHPNSLVAIKAISRDFNVVISLWKTNSVEEKNLDTLLERGEHVTVVSHSLESLEFKNNQASGNGICTYTDGSKYTGTWISDFKHGKGKLEFINGGWYMHDEFNPYYEDMID